MDINHETLRGGAQHMADKAGEVAERATHAARHMGNDVSAWVHRRPIETALLSAGAACVVTALAFWATRPD